MFAQGSHDQESDFGSWAERSAQDILGQRKYGEGKLLHGASNAQKKESQARLEAGRRECDHCEDRPRLRDLGCLRTSSTTSSGLVYLLWEEVVWF